MSNNIKKIAILYNIQHCDKALLLSLLDNFKQSNIECNLYDKSEYLIDSGFIPDLVLIFDPHEPKLTHYPTYALLYSDTHFLLSRKRLIRNILTYDGYLVSSQLTKEAIDDLMFSARKIGSQVVDFKITPLNTHSNFKINFSKSKIILLEKNSEKNPKIKFSPNIVTKYKLDKILLKFDSSKKISELYQKNGVGLCYFGCDDINKNISFKLTQIITAGALAITNWSEYLYSIFGDNILYIPNNTKKKKLAKKIKAYKEWIIKNPELATKKAFTAQQILLKNYSWKTSLNNLQDLHNKTLITKGYVADITQRLEMPSVSYFIRTGGNPAFLRCTLDSLIAQQYPNLQVVLIIYKPLEILQQIKDEYENKLNLKIAHSTQKLRSTGIVTGIKNVDGEYFGMIDDDDTFHSNHIYSLIKTIEHNNKFSNNRYKVAYSGNYYLSDLIKFAEDPEWHDNLLLDYPSKRAVEHFKFYNADMMASHTWYMMSNSWIAHRSLINEEVTRDINTHSHEDLYYEMLFSMQTKFAFSCEMTASHYFHGNNCTIVDKERGDYDKFRRNLNLYFRTNPAANKFYRPVIKPVSSCIEEITFPVPKALPPEYLENIKFANFMPFKRSKKVKKILSKIKRLWRKKF